MQAFYPVLGWVGHPHRENTTFLRSFEKGLAVGGWREEILPSGLFSASFFLTPPYEKGVTTVGTFFLLYFGSC